ncbi:MAG TPA: Rad52/Rad22 family DNA repair protein [Longimicrobiaceae bacterium]|nr:Rad52/Rad22 family DNA repair protein [Longimicrobiaceae bacterium]
MSEIDFRSLQAVFTPDEIEWRVSQVGEKNGRIWAVCVPYVTNRAIQARLDEVVGPGNWRNEFVAGPDGGVLCGLSVRIRGEWITKWDGAENTDVEGVKGGLSAAMKRAAVQWGIGRYLYALEESFARVHEKGRLRGKLRDGTPQGKPFRWDPPELPAWALPAEPAESGEAAADGRLAAEHEAMLDFVRTVGPMVGERAEIRVHRRMLNLREFVRENWAAIKEQPRVARTVVEAIEGATGMRFHPGVGEELRPAA